MSPAESGTCSGLDKVSDKWGGWGGGTEEEVVQLAVGFRVWACLPRHRLTNVGVAGL